MLSESLAAAAHGAALVYHQIVAVQNDVTKWEADNPQIAPLVAAGSQYAVSALDSAGIPVLPLVSAGTAVLSALKALAAADPTVASGGAAIGGTP